MSIALSAKRLIKSRKFFFYLSSFSLFILKYALYEMCFLKNRCKNRDHIHKAAFR